MSIMNALVKEKYEVNVECTNCNADGTIFVRKGRTINENLKLVRCNLCGCKTLVLTNKVKKEEGEKQLSVHDEIKELRLAVQKMLKEEGK